MGDSRNGTATAAVLEKLTQEFPNAVLKPGSEQYEEANTKFWNKDNEAVRPALILTPSSAQEIGSIIPSLAQTQTPFALRSGGYMPYPSYNTSPSILLSTSNFTSIELLPGDLVRFGAGTQWGAVYDFLEPLGLVVPGGRSRPVGVSGLLLHGGVSHFYGEVGWACESVEEFEVVLASGSVVVANAKENADLFWALRGGGKNFGLVTRFTMRTKKLPKMWGGARILMGSEESAGRVFETVHAGLEGEVDEKAHLEVITFFNPTMCPGGDPIIVLSLAYAAEEVKPEAFGGLLEIPAVADMTRVATQRELADDEKDFVGYDKRGLFRGVPYRGSLQLTMDLYKTFYALVKEQDVFSEDPMTAVGLIWYPPSRKLAAGHSVIHLAEDAEPYFAAGLLLRWTKPEASQKMHATADILAQHLMNKVKQDGEHVPFTYANIAGTGDVTYAGLPEKKRERLREVAGKYDPQGVFQKLVAGFGLE